MADQPSAGPGPGTGALTPGQLFGGYRIIRLLGRGGMGAVYEAESVEDGRLVALKLLDQDLDDSDARRRFLREGHLAAALNHPNTVYIYGTGEVDGTPTIAMELVAGGTLEEKVQQRGALPIQEAIDDTLQIIDGLAAAQSLGILHRDIKPSNCFVALDGSVKVGDFGLSRSVAGDKETRVTKTGMFIGTPAFSAPEQLLGEPLDVRSDIYSVGATLYSLLTGKLPFAAVTAINMLAVVLQGTPASPRTHRPEIPESLAAIVLKCLQRKPDDRYSGYAELRSDLEALRERSGSPASVPARIGALALDLTLLFALTLALMLIPGLFHAVSGESLRAKIVSSAIYLFGLLLLKAVPEGLWGVSLGKALLGIRVEQVDGGRLGLPRGVGRMMVLWLPLLISDVVRAIGGASPNAFQWAALVACYLAIVSTMRRANGLAGLHDLLFKTRVVRPTLLTDRRQSIRQQSAEPVVPEGSDQIGPFAVLRSLSTLADGSALLLGFDPTLHRIVWIHRHAEERPPLTASRRGLAREGRLRWVASRRAPTESWDAYEAPEGRPLLAPEAAGVSWEITRDRLSDLAAELAAASGSDESVVLELDRVWITPGQRATLLDFPVGPAAGEPIGPRTGAFLAGVAHRSLWGPAHRSDRQWPVLPLPARALLDDVAGSDDPASIAERLSAIGDLPPAVTRRKRSLAMALTAGPAFAIAAITWSSATFAERMDPQMARLAPLLDYVASPPRQSDSTIVANQRTIGIYLASGYRGFLADRTHRKGFWGTNVRWPAVDSSLARYQTISPEESRRAAETVDVEWGGLAPGELATSSRPAIYATAGGGLTLIVIGLLSLVAALLFRIGWAGRAAGIEIVSAAGQRAGRLRLLARAALIWLPILGPVFVLVSTHMGKRVGAVLGGWASLHPPADLGATLLLGAFVLLAIAGIGALVSAVRTPERGLVDRLVGTNLVPR
ncbi:MAG: protein kinase [Gemmatimonadota bacterium]